MSRWRATTFVFLVGVTGASLAPACAVHTDPDVAPTEAGASPDAALADASAPDSPEVVDADAKQDAPAPAPDAGACAGPDDCPSRVCTSARVCAPATPTDGVKNAGETDVDCGGPLAPPCPPSRDCLAARDCASGVCRAYVCRAPTSTDGVKNGDETDVDCGGPGGPACADGDRCLFGGDCASGVCLGQVCRAPASTDGVKNGDETDVDCGGAGNPRCAEGRACVVPLDCASSLCAGLRCEPDPLTDGVKNGDETDVDCGGTRAPACRAGRTCAVASDCTSRVCASGPGGSHCQAPSATDGVKNGDETDVDCGGGGAPACPVGKACLANADCATDGCAYDRKCALGRSCTARFGGDTCGLGEVGEPGAVHESCCATGDVTVAGNVVHLDKYQVTAGRMRAFVERVNGDVRGFVRAARAEGRAHASLMSPTWDAFLPTSLEGNADPTEIADATQDHPALVPGMYTSVNRHLGGTIFRGNQQSTPGCYVTGFGTHTYWLPPAVQAAFGDAPHEHGRDVYDTKPLNCVDFLMAQAFCIWDGGRVETIEEAQAAWGPDDLPWGSGPLPKAQGSATLRDYRFPLATDASLRANPGVPPTLVPAPNQSIEYANFGFSYEYPARQAQDYVVFMSAPGRMRGRGRGGHADVIGNVLELSSTLLTPNADPRLAKNQWVSQGSWEGHLYGKSFPPFQTMLLNKYGKAGVRCAHP